MAYFCYSGRSYGNPLDKPRIAGFNYNKVNKFMDSIRATLDAAYIQGFLGFFGALLGAIALIFSILIAAKQTLKTHKADKLAEARRDIYLELIENWNTYLIVFNYFRVIPDSEKYQNLLSETITKFNISISKTSFLTESENRLSLEKFSHQFMLEIPNQRKLVSKWYESLIKENNSENLFNIELEIFKSFEPVAKSAYRIETLLRNELDIPNDDLVEDKVDKLRELYLSKAIEELAKIYKGN